MSLFEKIFYSDIIEYEEKLKLYKKYLSNSLTSPICENCNIQLEMSFIFKKIIESINKSSKKEIMKIFRKFWNKNMVIVKPNIILICELANLFFTIIGSKEKIDIKLFKHGKQKFNFLDKLHEEEIINLYENKDGIFAKFIKETWGARNRLLVYLNKISELVPIMLEEGYSPLKEILKIGRFI